MSKPDFINVRIPKTPKKKVLRRSWDKTVQACEMLLENFSKQKLAEIGEYIPKNLESGKHGDRVGAIMAVYRFQINEICLMALETESFRRLYRRDQDLILDGLDAKTSREEDRRVQELLRQLQRDEIQAANKKAARCGKSANRREREAKKARRREEDRLRTSRTQGPKGGVRRSRAAT